MCRWFAYISSTEPTLLEDILITPQHSITKQVHEHYLPGLFTGSKFGNEHTSKKEIAMRNRLFNSDGLGVGWYTTARSEFGVAAPSGSGEESGVISLPALYRTTQPPNNDANFASICANTSSLCVFAHIRMATSVVTQFNNHPFVFGRHSFMHNGFVDSFIDIKREVSGMMHPDAYAHVFGTTDSEHLAAIYMTFLCEGEGKGAWMKQYPLEKMKEAMDKTVQLVQDVQKKKTESSGIKFGPNDLNLCTTDGEQLVAIRWRSAKEEQPPSLYYSETAGVKLNRKYPGSADGQKTREGKDVQDPEEHGKHVIVASEPTTSDAKEWHLINKNQVVMVDKNSKVHHAPINATF